MANSMDELREVRDRVARITFASPEDRMLGLQNAVGRLGEETGVFGLREWFEGTLMYDLLCRAEAEAIPKDVASVWVTDRYDLPYMEVGGQDHQVIQAIFDKQKPLAEGANGQVFKAEFEVLIPHGGSGPRHFAIKYMRGEAGDLKKECELAQEAAEKGIGPKVYAHAVPNPEGIGKKTETVACMIMERLKPLGRNVPDDVTGFEHSMMRTLRKTNGEMTTFGSTPLDLKVENIVSDGEDFRIIDWDPDYCVGASNKAWVLATTILSASLSKQWKLIDGRACMLFRRTVALPMNMKFSDEESSKASELLDAYCHSFDETTTDLGEFVEKAWRKPEGDREEVLIIGYQAGPSRYDELRKTYNVTTLGDLGYPQFKHGYGDPGRPKVPIDIGVGFHYIIVEPDFDISGWDKKAMDCLEDCLTSGGMPGKLIVLRLDENKRTLKSHTQLRKRQDQWWEQRHERRSAECNVPQVHKDYSFRLIVHGFNEPNSAHFQDAQELVQAYEESIVPQALVLGGLPMDDAHGQVDVCTVANRTGAWLSKNVEQRSLFVDTTREKYDDEHDEPIDLQRASFEAVIIDPRALGRLRRNSVAYGDDIRQSLERVLRADGEIIIPAVEEGITSDLLTKIIPANVDGEERRHEVEVVDGNTIVRYNGYDSPRPAQTLIRQIIDKPEKEQVLLLSELSDNPFMAYSVTEPSKQWDNIQRDSFHHILIMDDHKANRLGYDEAVRIMVAGLRDRGDIVIKHSEYKTDITRRLDQHPELQRYVLVVGNEGKEYVERPFAVLYVYFKEKERSDRSDEGLYHDYVVRNREGVGYSKHAVNAFVPMISDHTGRYEGPASIPNKYLDYEPSPVTDLAHFL